MSPPRRVRNLLHWLAAWPPMPRREDPMFLAMNAWRIGFDAAAVIGLRMMKLSAGDTAAAIEAQRMVSEKIKAALDLQMLLITGELGRSPASIAAKSLNHYARGVRTNRRRLSKR